MPDYIRSHTGAAAPQLRPEFFMDSVPDEPASVAAGRYIYREVESVKLIVPGITATVVVQRVNRSHIERYPEAYKAWKEGLEAPISGTPIEVWPFLNRSQVEELRRMKVRTVEDIAYLNDNAIAAIGMGAMAMRQRARAFLDDSEREALASRLTAENDSLRADVATLQHQLDDLAKHVASLSERNEELARREYAARHYVDGMVPLPQPGAATQPQPGAVNGFQPAPASSIATLTDGNRPVSGKWAEHDAATAAEGETGPEDVAGVFSQLENRQPTEEAAA